MKNLKQQIEQEKRRERWLQEQETLNRGRFTAEEAMRLARGSNKPLRIGGSWVYPTLC